jgi:hypothetical protein
MAFEIQNGRKFSMGYKFCRNEYFFNLSFALSREKGEEVFSFCYPCPRKCFSVITSKVTFPYFMCDKQNWHDNRKSRLKSSFSRFLDTFSFFSEESNSAPLRQQSQSVALTNFNNVSKINRM